MAEEKLLRLSKVKPGGAIKSVSQSVGGSASRRAFDVLFEAQSAWDAMSRFRQDRLRNKGYMYGDQWGDIIDVDGKAMTEETYIKSQGNVPLKNNLIRRLVKNVIGVYRSQAKEPICEAYDRDEQRLGEAMSTLLQCNMQRNRMSEVYARTVEEYLMSGLVAHRKWYGWNPEKQTVDCWTSPVQPDNFFIDNFMRDVRGWDVSLLGEIHDCSIEQVCREFAKSPADYKKLKDIYHLAVNQRVLRSGYGDWFGGYGRRSIDFLLVNDPSRCRVIEVWRKESKPRYRCHDYLKGEYYVIDEADYRTEVEAVNMERMSLGLSQGMTADDIPLIEAEWFMDDHWHYYFLTPFGDILSEGETPYEHKSHPYVFKAYPFIDGEIHSFVADVIDQQRYTNRLITMYDWVMRAGAKGVLLVPEQALEGTNMTPDDFADEWSRFNGVIVYKAKAGIPAPQQVVANSTNIGISELLSLQLKFFEDISGVNSVMQGQASFAGESGSHAQMMSQSAAMSLLDLLDSFNMFVIDAAYKDVKNMQQYYDDKRVMNIVGKNGKLAGIDPKKVLNLECDLKITDSTSTPTYRQAANEFLMQIWQTGQITLEQLLEHGDFPFADDLLQSIKSQREQIERGEMPNALPQQLQQQVQNGANMDTVNQLYGAMKG